MSPIAETTTHTWLPARRVRTIRWATRLIASASLTLEPPYFCTMRLMRTSPVRCDRPAGV